MFSKTMSKTLGYITTVISASLPAVCWSQESTPSTDTPDFNRCLALMGQTADDDMTVAELRSACQRMIEGDDESLFESREAPTKKNVQRPTDAGKSAEANGDKQEQPEAALDTRMEMEALNRSNRFLLTPHNRNFILPVSYTHQPNEAPFEEDAGENINFQNVEIEFQLSMKVLIAQDLFHNNGDLYIAYTNHSFWQAYNTDISRPFRETNHEPELILSVNNDWEILGFRNAFNQLALAHQSNGQSGVLSRSWNRIKGRSVFERGNLALSLSAWYRLPESPEKDDNPDIDDYYGYYELGGAYRHQGHIVSFMTRRPFEEHATIELGWSFPISSTVRGYLKVFDGYGASMIDYNIKTQSIGLGVVFTDLF